VRARARAPDASMSDVACQAHEARSSVHIRAARCRASSCNFDRHASSSNYMAVTAPKSSFVPGDARRSRDRRRRRRRPLPSGKGSRSRVPFADRKRERSSVFSSAITNSVNEEEGCPLSLLLVKSSRARRERREEERLGREGRTGEGGSRRRRRRRRKAPGTRTQAVLLIYSASVIPDRSSPARSESLRELFIAYVRERHVAIHPGRNIGSESARARARLGKRDRAAKARRALLVRRVTNVSQRRTRMFARGRMRRRFYFENNGTTRGSTSSEAKDISKDRLSQLVRLLRKASSIFHSRSGSVTRDES